MQSYRGVAQRKHLAIIGTCAIAANVVAAGITARSLQETWAEQRSF